MMKKIRLQSAAAVSSSAFSTGDGTICGGQLVHCQVVPARETLVERMMTPNSLF